MYLQYSSNNNNSNNNNNNTNNKVYVVAVGWVSWRGSNWLCVTSHAPVILYNSKLIR